MNKIRRKELSRIKDKLSELSEIMENLKDELEGLSGDIESVKDEEDECFNNLTESLQLTDRGISMEDNVNDLDSAKEELDDIISSLNDMDIDFIISSLEEVIDR